jgi:hypothetical protein
VEEQQTVSSGVHTSESTILPRKRPETEEQKKAVDHRNGSKEHGFRRIIRNFTPS